VDGVWGERGKRGGDTVVAGLLWGVFWVGIGLVGGWLVRRMWLGGGERDGRWMGGWLGGYGWVGGRGTVGG